MFGACIESVANRSDGRQHASLHFWYDGAAVYARPGAKFEVWYSRAVGEGVVVPTSTDDVEVDAYPGAAGWAADRAAGGIVGSGTNTAVPGGDEGHRPARMDHEISMCRAAQDNRTVCRDRMTG